VNLLDDIPKDPEQRDATQQATYDLFVRAVDNPRGNLHNYSVLSNAFRVLALQMNPIKIQGGKTPKFITNNGDPCMKSHGKKKGLRIEKLSESGRAKLHGSCFSQNLSPVQEAWIILHAKKLHCGLFLEPEFVKHGNKKVPTGVKHVVTPNQGSGTTRGGPASYQPRDVVFFKKSLDLILAGRDAEEKKPIEQRFLYFDFPDAKDADIETTGTKRSRDQGTTLNAPPTIDAARLERLKQWRMNKFAKKN